MTGDTHPDFFAMCDMLERDNLLVFDSNQHVAADGIIVHQLEETHSLSIGSTENYGSS